MALKDYGKPENDLGEWMPFGIEAPFDLRIRKIPYEIAQRIGKRYGRESYLITDGMKRPTIDRSLEESNQWLFDQALWAWTDARGLEVEVCDVEGAKLWSQLLKRDVAMGETVPIDASVMTAEVKRRVLTSIRPWCTPPSDSPGVNDEGKPEKQDISTFIVLQAVRLAAVAAQRAEAREANS